VQSQSRFSKRSTRFSLMSLPANSTSVAVDAGAIIVMRSNRCDRNDVDAFGFDVTRIRSSSLCTISPRYHQRSHRQSFNNSAYASADRSKIVPPIGVPYSSHVTTMVFFLRLRQLCPEAWKVGNWLQSMTSNPPSARPVKPSKSREGLGNRADALVVVQSRTLHTP